MRKSFLRSIFLLSLAGAITLPAQAQRKYDRGWMEPELSEPIGWSLGMTVGLSDLWGDVGTRTPLDHYTNSEYWGNTRFMGGVYARYAFHPAISARLSANFGTLYANDNWNKNKAEKADKLSDDYVQRYLRNQDVRSFIWEGTLMAEVMPFRFDNTTAMARKRMQPYVMAGIGAFNHRSQSTWKSRPENAGGYGQWKDIYDLHLEGDGWKFDGAPKLAERWNIAVPLGIGLRWDVGRNVGLGVEYLYRVTFTDYIDGVSDKYLPANYYDAQLPADKVSMAMDLADKTWQITGKESYRHAPGEIRGNKADNDHYSTLSFNIFYKINTRRKPWWF